MRLILGLLAASLICIIACGTGNTTATGREAPLDPVSVARIRMGEKVNGECLFEDVSIKYPVTYSGISEDCYQAVGIGPLGPDELEQMKRDEPSFWEKSFPYQQVLVGERIEGHCDFSSPAVQAYLAFSEPTSTDWTNCIMTVDVGPATERQIEEVERHGSTAREAAVPARPEPAPGQ